MRQAEAGSGWNGFRGLCGVKWKLRTEPGRLRRGERGEEISHVLKAKGVSKRLGCFVSSDATQSSVIQTQKQPVAFLIKQALDDWVAQWCGGDRSHTTVGWQGRSCWVGSNECKLLSGCLSRKLQKGSKWYLEDNAEGQRGFFFLRTGKAWTQQMVKEKVRVVDNSGSEIWGTRSKYVWKEFSKDVGGDGVQNGEGEMLIETYLE